jgi:hypothetical protein
MELIKGLFLEKRFDILLLMIAACFPIYMHSISGVLLPAVGVGTILLFIYQKRTFNRHHLTRKFQYFFVTTIFYVIQVFSLIYTTDLSFGISILIHGIYILVYPLVIIFFVGKITNTHFNLITSCFVITCFIYVVYIHYCFFNAGLYSNFKPAEFNELPFRDTLMGLKVGGRHPTFVSMWLLFSVLFLVHYLSKKKSTLRQTVMFGLMIFIFIATTILLSVKITVVAFFFSLLVLIYRIIRNKFVVIVAFGALTTIFIISIYTISFLRARFIDEFRIAELKPPVGLRTNSINIRVGIYQCTYETFKKNWFIGTGVGDSQYELNKCYESFDTDVYKERVYDTHNNYMDIGVSTGIIGLFSFVYMLFFHLKESIRQKNTLFIVFLVFIMICMLPENILSRNHGVVFYTIFSSLLMKFNLQEDPSL